MDRNMTYGELLDALHKFSPANLQKLVRISCGTIERDILITEIITIGQSTIVLSGDEIRQHADG